MGNDEAVGDSVARRGWRRPAVAIAATGAVVAMAVAAAGITPIVVQAASAHHAKSYVAANEVSNSAVQAQRSSTGAPSGLQAAIDKTLVAQPMSSPSGVTLHWGKDGAVAFGRSHVRSGAELSLRPVAIFGNKRLGFTPGQFIFGETRTTEDLGHGVVAWYKDTSEGFEQGFTVQHVGLTASGDFTIGLAHAGLRLSALGSSGAVVSGRSGPELVYDGLRATDAAGKVMPARMSVDGNLLRIVVEARRASWPVTIDPYIAPATTATASFVGTGAEQLGYSVSLSADGQEALVGAPDADNDNGAAYIFAESDGAWLTAPIATFTGSSGAQLGTSVSLSGNGQEALIGDSWSASTAAIYEESNGVWPSSPTITFTGQGYTVGDTVALSENGQVAIVGGEGYDASSGRAVIYTKENGSWSTTPTATFTGSTDSGLGKTVALSADGQEAAIGFSAGLGSVELFTESSGSWSTTPTTTFYNGGAYEFGNSLSFSSDGQMLFIGSPGNNAAYLYEESNGVWPSSATYTFSGASGSGFGNSVALSADGRTALIGAYSTNSDAGAAYVYTMSDGAWPTTPTDTFTGTGSEELGNSAALSADGQVALVGAYEAGSGTAGAAYVYGPRNVVWQTTPVGSFTGSTGNEFGFSAAISADGRSVAVGAPGASNSNGAVYLYTKSNGQWPSTPSATFTGSGSEGLGYSVGISANGQVVVAGAPFASSNDGAVYLYSESNGSWPTSPSATFTISSTGELGYSVGISANGQVVVVGAPVVSNGDGAVYLYSESNGSWPTSPSATFDGGTSARFGDSLAISANGATVVIGSPDASNGNGAVYLYSGANGTWPASPTTAFPGSSGEELGYSVAVSATGNAIVAGAPSVSGNNGAAYLYAQSGGTWQSSPSATFTGSNAEELGYSVALSADGQVAALGAIATGEDGATFIYSELKWVWPSSPTATIIGSGTDYAGYEVAMSSDGETVALGAPEASNGGAVSVYDALGVVNANVTGSQVYGSSSTPAFAYSADQPTSIAMSGTPTCTEDETGTAISASLAAGTYALGGNGCSGLSLSGTDNANYTLSYNGTFAVEPAPLTITATSTTITEGSPVPSISAEYSGFVLGQGPSDLTTAPVCSTTATSSSPPGTYPATCSGAYDPNYSISYVAGTVVVKAAPTTTTTAQKATTTTTAPPSTTTTNPPRSSTTTTTATRSSTTTTTATRSSTTTTTTVQRQVVVPPATTGASTTPTTAPQEQQFPSAGTTYPNSAIVDFAGHEYVFAGGRAFAIPKADEAKFRAADHARVTPAPAGAAAPVGSLLEPGTLLSTYAIDHDRTIYVAGTNGELYGFASWRQFADGGFDGALVVTVPGLDGLRVAGRSAGAAHLDALSTASSGAIVLDRRTYYVIAGGAAFPVPSSSALAQIRKTDKAKLIKGHVTKAEVGVVPVDGTLLSVHGQGVYVIANGAPYPFSAKWQLDAEGYGGTAAVPVPSTGTLAVSL